MSGSDDARSDRVRMLAAEIRTFDAQPLEGAGRGIVLVAGGARMFTNAYVLLKILRSTLGSTLPVEWWHFGPGEMSPAMAALVEPLGVRLVDANPLIAATGAAVRDAWQLKAFALVHSAFAEVLLLDADQVPVKDPAGCFAWPEYVETGAVFWPDIVELRPDNAIWSMMGLEPREGPSLESGQILVDRRRHGAALRAALRLNEAAEDLYQLIYGDKDTFLLAWLMLGAPFALPPHTPFADEFILVQRDFLGAPLFQHRTNAKWQHGVRQKEIPGFQHEAECLAALAELEQRWSGRVFAPPDRSAEARRLEAEILSAGPFRFEAPGETVAIEFAAHAEIRTGRAPDRRHWWVEEQAGQQTLILSGGDSRSYALDLGVDGIWRGKRHRLPLAEVALVPEDVGEPVAPGDRPGLVDDLLHAVGYDGLASPALHAALGLLATAIPGAAERLLRLADAETDTQRAQQLRKLLTGIATPIRQRDVDRTMKLETRYVRRGEG